MVTGVFCEALDIDNDREQDDLSSDNRCNNIQSIGYESYKEDEDLKCQSVGWGHTTRGQ